MANKMLMLLLLLGWGASAQTFTSTCTFDITELTKELQYKNEQVISQTDRLAYQEAEILKLSDKIMHLQDSLNFFVKYHKHSKHVIGPRLIGRIEEMIMKDE